MTQQSWADTNNYVIRARTELDRARDALRAADSAPTAKQRRAIERNLAALRSALREVEQTWGEGEERHGRGSITARQSRRT